MFCVTTCQIDTCCRESQCFSAFQGSLPSGVWHVPVVLDVCHYPNCFEESPAVHIIMRTSGFAAIYAEYEKITPVFLRKTREYSSSQQIYLIMQVLFLSYKRHSFSGNSGKTLSTFDRMSALGLALLSRRM